MKRAVVTGASGVLGSALVKKLLENGTEVLAILREGSPNNRRLADYVSGVPGSRNLLRVEECSLESLRSLYAEPGASGTRGPGSMDVFFHLGWTGTKGRDRFDPRIHTKNVEYALDAVELAARLGCRTFVGAGSQAEYGRTRERLRPDTGTFPENAYGVGKLCAGMATRILAAGMGIKHVWTRILSVYGPNDGERTLVTYLVRSLLDGARPVCTAGDQIWDYLFAEDAASALIAAAEKGRDGAVYLVASGRERPLKEYILEIRDVVSPGAVIGFGEVPYAENQVMHLSADITGLMRDTGWKPEVPFAEGIRRMAEEMARPSADVGAGDSRRQ